MKLVIKTFLLTLLLGIIGLLSLLITPTAFAGSPSVEGPACVASAQATGQVSGYAYFIPSSITVGPSQKVSATLRTYVCNGTSWIVENDYNAFGGSYVEETGKTGVVDFSPSGLPTAYGFRIADMGRLNPGTYRYKDISVLIDGSTFTTSRSYHIKLLGFGSVYYQQWQSGWEVGCGADGNPSTPTQRCTTNQVYSTYQMTVTVPIPKGTLQIVKYPERGATNASLSATAKYGSGGNIFTVSTSQNTNSANVDVASNYQATMSPATGFRVTRVRVNRQTGNGIATVCDPCSISGNTITGVSVVDGRTTWIDVFYEPDIRGSLDIACPRPNPGGPYDSNGKIAGWVIDYYYPQNSNNKNITPSDVRIRITEKDATGNLIGSTEQNYTVKADQDRPDLQNNTSNPQVGRYHGFSFDVPSQYFNGKKYDVKVFPLRNNAGIANPPSIYILGQKEMDCGGPRGSLDVADCTVNNSQGTIAGWGFDPQRPGQNPNLHFYFDSTPGSTSDPDAVYNRNNVVGTIPRPDVVTFLRNQGYPGVQDGTKYGFSEPFPDGLHDGEAHVVRVYLITQSGANPLIGSSGIQGASSQLVCEAWYYPWLQTQNGDVIASGKITGQRTDLPGSRLQNSAEKEAEYLVISVVGGDGPFCSTNSYILTNTSAIGGNCGNGNGYNVLDKYQLGVNPDDNVYNAILKAYNQNGGGNSSGNANTKCSPYNTFNNLFNPISTGTGTSGQPACLNGSIFKASGSLANLSVKSGRNTIFSDSELFILGDITYDYTGGYPQPDAEKKVPNLAIIVNGDVKIGTGVRRIDAAIYATGKVYTCNSNGNAGQTSPPEQCREQLVVNGMLVGKNGFLFGRSFFDSSRKPAESIILTGQTVAFPPPGLDSSNFTDFDNSVKIDSGEFQPRF